MLNHLKVLVANPDPGIRRLLRRHFESMDRTVITSETALGTINLVKRAVVDLVVASAAMPDMDAKTFTRTLHELVGAPVIMLLPPGEGASASQILDCGADDCIEEPFLLTEFSARARRLLARGGTRYRSRSVIRGLGLLEIEPLNRSVRLRGESIVLTRNEFGLLAVLAAGNGEVIPYDEILRKVWGSDYIGAIQNLRRVVSGLRHKIEPDPSHPVYITSVRGSGYRLAPGEAAPAHDRNSPFSPDG